MIKTRFLVAAASAILAAAAHAAGGSDVNLDGSAKTHKPTLATAANHQLQNADVPSVKTDPGSVKSQADADMAARDARAKAPRLVVQRQNLKGAAAARAMQQQATPNSIDRATAYGDIDHTEQVTDVSVSLKK